MNNIKILKLGVGCALMLLSSPGAVRAGSFWDAFRLGYDGSDTPGAPRAPALVARHLVEDGYELREPINQDGPVYFAVVSRNGRLLCLMLDSFNETVLQRFDFTATGLKAEIADSPGPGYPGYPPFSDGRFAAGCHEAELAAPSPPSPVVPPHPVPAPKPPRIRILPHRTTRRPRRRPLPSCRPIAKPTEKSPSVKVLPDALPISIQGNQPALCPRFPT